MDITQLLKDCILVIFLVYVHCGITFGIDEDYEDMPASFSRCPWIRNKLKNGRVKYRYRGRVAKFVCDAGYELAGKRSATCVAGQWSNPLPVCVARGCSRMPSIANGRITEMYRGALLGYDCNPGYSLHGASSIHCDGRRWNTTPPVCSAATENPEAFCDFESPDLCGWSHDPNHDFDWRRNQFSTPSGHAGTGPSYDHTFGESKGGYYLYIEASTPRKLNDSARIFSPVYFPSQSGGCFLFWYHMYGATTGGLRVYLKPESHVLDELTPNWERYGDQGNQWRRGNIDIPSLNEKFQIVIEGIRGDSYVGDSAIDDVSLSPNDCLSMENETGITEEIIADSCRGRCREADSGSACGCNENCNAAKNCCRDYITLCYEVPGNETAGPNPEEPGDFYGKTTIPSTITATFSTEITTSVKLSTDATSMSTAGFSAPSSAPSTTLSTVPATTSAMPITTSAMPITTSAMSITTSAIRPTIFIPSTASSTSASSSTSDMSSYETTISSTTTTAEIKTTIAPKPISQATTTSKQTIGSMTSKLTASSPTTISTTPIPTTIRSTTPTTTTFRPITIWPTTTVASTTSSAQTSALSTTAATAPSTTGIPSQIFTNPSTENDKMTSVSSTTTTPNTYRTTESPQPTTYPDITTFSSTRWPYNLRPRPRTTTFSVSTESSSVRDSTIPSTTSISSTTPDEKKATPFASSTYASTIWHNFPVTKSPTLSSTIPTTKLPTTSPTIKMTTSTAKTYTETGSQINRNPTQKFPFRVTTTPFSLQDKLDQQDTSKLQTSASSGSPPVVVTVIVIAIISIVAGAVYYVRRQRNQRQSKLSEDSEMRFLEENEYLEYSDASALDKILIK